MTPFNERRLLRITLHCKYRWRVFRGRTGKHECVLFLLSLLFIFRRVHNKRHVRRSICPARIIIEYYSDKEVIIYYV